MRDIVAQVLSDSAIPIVIGISLFFIHRAHPEKFPPWWTRRRVIFLSLLLTVGSVLLSFWGAYSHSR